jgi:hypothetical protein
MLIAVSIFNKEVCFGLINLEILQGGSKNGYKIGLGVTKFSHSLFQNALVYFSMTDKRECDQFQLQTAAYSSMDVIESRENAPNNRSQELFYGYLYSNSEYKVVLEF